MSPSPTSILPDEKNFLQQQFQVEKLSPEHPKEDSMGPTIHNFSSLSSQRPFHISPEIFIHNPLLRALTKQLLQEPWYINGDQERLISEEEGRLRLGPVGKSIFLAYARRISSANSRTHWSCLICEAPNGTADQIVSGYAREDRMLRHIQHHFKHRPWVCSGQCGTTHW